MVELKIPNEQTPPGQTAAANPALGSTESLKGTVSEADALKGVEHTKISTLQPITGANGQPAPTGNAVSVGGMVDAKLAVELMDSLLPSIFVVTLHAVGMKLKKTDLQLTAKEKETVAPVLQKCLDTLMLNFNNPWNMLGVTMVVIYGAKIGEKGVGAWIDSKAAEKENKELQTKVAESMVDLQTKQKHDEEQQKIEAKKKQDEAIAVWMPDEDAIAKKIKKDKITRTVAISRLKFAYAKQFKK